MSPAEIADLHAQVTDLPACLAIAERMARRAAELVAPIEGALPPGVGGHDGHLLLAGEIHRLRLMAEASRDAWRAVDWGPMLGA